VPQSSAFNRLQLLKGMIKTNKRSCNGQFYEGLSRISSFSIKQYML